MLFPLKDKVIVWWVAFGFLKTDTREVCSKNCQTGLRPQNSFKLEDICMVSLQLHPSLVLVFLPAMALFCAAQELEGSGFVVYRERVQMLKFV